jgi:hypothetical protein
VNPAEEYGKHRGARVEEVATFERHSALISNLRVLAFLLLAGAIYLAATHRASGWLMVPPLLLFVALLVLHDRILQRKKRAERAVEYWEDGLARIAERFAGRGDGGVRFADHVHPYARDLDLFGPGSLFQLLNTARTGAGEETLAAWLLAPAEVAEVRARQDAVRELRERLSLREALALAGEEVRAEVEPKGLARWGAAAPVLVGTAAWLGVSALTLASAVALTGWIALWWNPLPVAVVVAVVAVVMRVYRVRVASVHGGVDRPGRDLQVLALVVGLFEREQFTSAKLSTLVACLRGEGAAPSRAKSESDAGRPTATRGEPASERIARLARLVDWANAQRNQFFAPIGWLLLWPVHFAYAIERWRARSGKEVERWLAIIGELEALSALAGYSYERPDEPFPVVVDDGPKLVASELGHPLIPRARVVRNSLSLVGEAARVFIISGSNMSGKSTMLRTVGVNVVLALAGAPVRAKSMSLSPLAVGATLRIEDSLQEGASRFYAEITRLKKLVDIARGKPPLLFLLDEILAGTNSHDRKIGAEALIEGLLDEGAVGLVTTHDLALAEMRGLGARSKNVHFQDRMVDGKLVFDYRMCDGVVTHSNALALMRAVGLTLKGVA